MNKAGGSEPGNGERLDEEAGKNQPSQICEVADQISPDSSSNSFKELYGYEYCAWKQLLFYCGVALTLGALYLVTHWKSVWRVLLTKKSCSLRHADTIIIQTEHMQSFVERVVIVDLSNHLISNYGSLGNVSRSSFDGVQDFILTDKNKSNSRTIKSSLAVRERILLKYFDHRHVRFVWSCKADTFVQLTGLEQGTKSRDIIEKFRGLTMMQSSCRLKLFGENKIDVEVKSYALLFIEEVFNPFYVFQIFSVSVWYSDNYFVFASCIIIISLFSLSLELYETRKQRETLREKVASDNESPVNVLRPTGEICGTTAKSLVPGDIIVLPPGGGIMSCDVVLLSGNAIVDEGMLTGESVPVTKTPLTPLDNDELYSPEAHKRNTLFCGTHVIQTRFYLEGKVMACVVRTGFSTAKGELVRSILYSNQVFFKFYSDSFKFIGVLGCMALIGFIYIAIYLTSTHVETKEIIIRVLDIITVAVPPSLPAAMTVGIIYAQGRLKKRGIFCISPPRINLCAKIQCYCFDKTGTLTEDGLDLLAVVPTRGDKFEDVVHDPKHLKRRSRLAIAMATCHSLTLIGGELKGDPLDLKMFQSVDWVLEEPGEDQCKFDLLIPTVVRPVEHQPVQLSDLQQITSSLPEVGIVRQFTFSSSLQRMSVVVRVLGEDHMDIYAKGSPEQIAALCLPETVPAEFPEVLQFYTSRGFRVIGVAAKSLDPRVNWIQVQHIARTAVESELRFIGVIIFENKLKSATSAVLEELQQANIRTVMVTGDNIMTACSVARNSGLVSSSAPLITVNGQPPETDKPAFIKWEAEVRCEGEEPLTNTDTSTAVNIKHSQYRLAVSGRSFAVVERYFPELMSKICLRGAVFARMSPDQKTKLIVNLQQMGLYVGMCGDGANDCGALRVAHAGISLSTAEASVASPFTSNIPDISCVPALLKEGRAALVTSFSIFKFIALYSIVQFVSVLILTSKGARLSDYMFLYIDLFISTIMSIVMGQTGPYHMLVRKRPPSSLVSGTNIFSLVVHTAMVIGFQVATLFYVESQPWYVSVESVATGHKLEAFSVLTTVIFYNTCFQYLTLVFVLSRSYPYRKPFWTNIPFTVCLILLTSLTVLLVFYPPAFLQQILKVVMFQSVSVRLVILGLAAIHFLLAVLFENFLIESGIIAATFKKTRWKKKKATNHEIINNELDSDLGWPPIGQVTYAQDIAILS